jgi:hypothetical protein
MKLSVLICAMVLSAAGIPRFSDFPPDRKANGRPARIELSAPFQRKFRTRIQGESKLDPNFASHYRIAEWGCGSSCVSLAVIDLSTGAVYDGPIRTLGYGVRRRYEGGEKELEYTVSSRLMIARGCPDDTRCGTYYFDWVNNRFRQLRFVTAGPVVESILSVVNRPQ